jgi:hypothetical protein
MNWFQKNLLSYCKLKTRGVYAVTAGERAGGFMGWVKEESSSNSEALLFCPSPMEAILVNKDEVREFLHDGKLVLVERLPKDVYEVVAANWNYLNKENK